MKKSGTGKAITFGLALGLMSSGILFTHHEAQAQTAPGINPYLLQRIDLSLGLEEMSGDITTAIGGGITHANGQTENTFFPISELEWPLDVLLARFDAAFTLTPYLRFNATIKTDLNEPDDYMIDQDWYSASGRTDVYSETSIAEFDAFIFDVDLKWTYASQGPWNLYTGVGYLHQNFEYVGDPIMQYSPTGMTGYNYAGNGTAGITYETTYSMIYFLLGADIQMTPQFNLSGNFSVAPVASAEDDLHHLFYNKISTGDMDGTAYMFKLAGNFHFAPWWFLEVGGQYTNISVDGTQDQVLAGQALGRIDMEVESEQASAYITMGYSF